MRLAFYNQTWQMHKQWIITGYIFSSSSILDAILSNTCPSSALFSATTVGRP